MRRALAALDKRDWDAAAKTFAQATATLKGERADAALYWRAYALHKSGRRDEALQSIAALRFRCTRGAAGLDRARAPTSRSGRPSGQAAAVGRGRDRRPEACLRSAA